MPYPPSIPLLAFCAATCVFQIPEAGGAQLQTVSAGPLKVGLATADITPEGPVWMAGFAARKKPSEGVYKELQASCVVFDNDAVRVAFVAVDLCKIYEKQLADLRAAALEADIGPQCVMINASHSHAGPALDQRKNGTYVALFKARTDPLFKAAVADLKPAVVDYTVGSSTMAINRRQLNDKGRSVGMRPEPRKPIDPAVPILRVLSPDGKVRAVVFGYACHPSTTNDYRVGPDYPGFARDWIAVAYPGALPVFLQGCGADIKPRYTRPNGRFGHVLLDPVRTTAELGHELGRAVVAALTVPPERMPPPVQLGGIVEKVDVPDKKAPQSNAHRIYMGAWRIGDVYVFGSQCELGVNIGLRIKRELPTLHVWPNGYTHWGGGYVLDAASYPEGGYEINTSAVSPATADIVVGNAVRYIRALQAGQTGAGPVPEPAESEKR